MKANGTRLSFAAVGRRAVRRLVLARWLDLLGRTALPMLAIGGLLAVGLWVRGGVRFTVPIAVGLVLGWAVLCAAWAWFRRPSPLAALAIWDEHAGRHEMFVSAFCFEQETQPGPGERVHLVRACQRLDEDLGCLRRDLPARLPRRAWLVPLLLPAIVLLLPAEPAPPADRLVGEAERAAAREVAERLSERAKVERVAEGLSPEEKERLEKLKTSIHETAERLKELGEQKTDREVLSELDERAHEAEQMADALEADAAATASSEMIAELERHADTTDFASALRAKDLEQAAEEARKLAERLGQKDLTQEQRRRIDHALQKSLAAAKEKDKQGLIGKHLQKAHQQLQAKRAQDASRQLQQLSRRLSQAFQRQQTQRQLQNLANQLRQSGQQIFGRNTGQIRRLAQNPPAGLTLLGLQQLQAGSLPLAQQLALTGQNLAAAPGQGQRQLLVPQPPGSGQSNPSASLPVPGTASSQPPGAMLPGGQGAGTMSIPVPGTSPGASGQGSSQQAGSPGGSGGSPVPGTGGAPAAAAMAGGGVGGLEAGRGTAPYGNQPTSPLAATKSLAVNAQISGEGPAQVRSVAGNLHREATEHDRRRLATEFLRAEEEALADEPLPLARREQVLRYFTALRRQLVEQEPSANRDR